jgi:hypothetical protein
MIRIPLLRRTRAGRSLLTLAVVGAVGAAGVFTTQATFTDQVTMASISVTGGTLDLKANTGDGPNQAWTGTISAAVTNLKPGDVSTGTVVIKNNGTLPFTLTASTTGTDASGCYGYYFHETSVAHDIASMGTGSGSDAVTAPLATSVTGSSLFDGATATTWAVNDSQTYTMEVRMKTSCTTNGAAGTLAVTLNATQ